jgi:hypothetical protein
LHVETRESEKETSEAIDDHSREEVVWVTRAFVYHHSAHQVHQSPQSSIEIHIKSALIIKEIAPVGLLIEEKGAHNLPSLRKYNE